VNQSVDLVDTLEKEGVALWTEGSRLCFRTSKGSMTAALRSQLQSQKDSLLAELRERAARNAFLHPASHGQRGLWFLHRANPSGSAYNVAFSARVRSRLDLPAMRRSFQALIDRHPSLRTTFSDESGDLVQRVHGFLPVSFAVHERLTADLGTLRKEVHHTSLVPFDLEKGPLMRVDLFTRTTDDHILLCTIHHIAADGWSLFLLLQDLGQIYPAEREGRAAVPARPAQTILGHARWQEVMLASAEGRAHEVYWLSKLAGAPNSLSMPTDRPRSASVAEHGASLSIDLGRELSDAVRAFAAAEGTTPFVVLLTAYQMLLYRYTGQPEVVVGSPSYGRDHAEFANVVGYLINTIPLKAAFADELTVRELLARTRDTVLEGIQHQDYPFSLIVEKLHPDRDTCRPPVFQTLFSLQKFQEVAGLEDLINNPDSQMRVEFGGLTLEAFPIPQLEGQFELAMELAEKGAVYDGVIKYDSALFDVSTMRRLSSHYTTLLRSMVASPKTDISQLPLLTSEERKDLVAGLNVTERLYPREQTVVELFDQQSARRPSAEALRFEGASLSYAELHVRSTRLARHLLSFGIGAESLVGLCLERGLDLVISILAILKAGAAYVPLDPAFPAERLRYMAEDSGAKILITQRALAERSFSGLDLECVYLDEDQAQINHQSNESLPPLAGPSNRAYVLYTSGSTGRPKGVEIEHRALTNFLCSMAREPGLTQNEVLLAVTTLGFDIAGLELFLPLVSGARIELASRETAMDGVALARTLSNSGATVMQATPATWRMLFDSGWRGDRSLKVLCGGEAMDRELAARLVSSCASVWNMYGPTETTIWSSLARIESDEVTIGRPIANTRMYVLDNHREPVPRGVVGELWIAGDGVARGYLNRPELTAERFVADPFRPGERMYRTGDLARHLADGRLECLGRIDNQVKIRGYRIELGEIETVLHTHPQVQGCVVAARSENESDARLIAYVVPGSAERPSTEELRTYLQTLLPDYMIPSGFVFLDAIPLTPNGKLDRNALSTLENNLPDQKAEYVAPRNEVEERMAEIWADVLGVKKVGVFDHFFELGGHSLSATRLLAWLKAAFEIDLPLRSLFIDPTIAGLSKHIVYDPSTQRYRYLDQIPRFKRLVPVQPKGSRIPLFLVAGFWDAEDTMRTLSGFIPHLGLDQPLYGFQPRWVEGNAERYSGVEEAASEFLAELLSVQPNGPYQLGGDCVGGVIAMAMADELMRRGEKVQLLVLLDTHKPSWIRSLVMGLSVSWRHHVQPRTKHIMEVIDQIMTARHHVRRQLVRDLARRKIHGDKAKPTVEVERDRLHRLRLDYIRTMYRHRLKNYPGKVTLIINEKQYKFDKSLGWGGIASGGIDTLATPGDHLTRFHHREEIAQRLISCLAKAQTEMSSVPC